MDTEPGRCRRTDGKKWRCKLAVLPNQKYCERHVHRGRERSRKHVEVNKTLLKSKLMSKSTTMTSISSLKITPNLESDAKATNAINHNKVGIKNESFKIKKHSWEKAGGPLELTFGESVLQHGTVRGCGTTSNKKTGVLVVAKSKKCRKTDGKKWQCSKEAVSEQKYCVEHIQRGAKKVENGQKANTGLSFLVGASYQQMNNDGMQSNDDSCSSSDATTVSV